LPGPRGPSRRFPSSTPPLAALGPGQPEPPFSCCARSLDSSRSATACWSIPHYHVASVGLNSSTFRGGGGASMHLAVGGWTRRRDSRPWLEQPRCRLRDWEEVCAQAH